MMGRRLHYLIFTGWLAFISGPLVAAEAAEGFAIGAGDVVSITVYEHPDLELRTRVSGSGKINYPLLGVVEVIGLTERMLEGRIASELAGRSLIKNPQVNVLIEDHLSNRVAVLGQVRSPGMHTLDYGNSLLELLAASGGLTEHAHHRISVLRGGDPNRTEQFDLSGLGVVGEQASTVPTLQPSDVVFVSRMDMFYVYGEVQQPGAYRLEPGMTVVQALSVAGSVTQTGTDRRIKIRRLAEGGNVREFDAELNDPVWPDDVVQVRERLF